MPYIGTPPASELANLDINGQKLIIDADADTSITADTDDQIDIEIAGADDFQFTANTFTAAASSVIALDDGAVATPSLTTTGDLNTGVYFPAADTVGVTAGGTEQFRFGSNPIPGASKNMIINGNMAVAQRGTTFAAIASEAFCLDRWETRYTSAGRVTITQDTSGVFAGLGGSVTAMKIDCTTAESSVADADFFVIRQMIESQNCSYVNYGNAAAKTVTISFNFQSPKSGTHTLTLFNNASTGRSYAAPFTVDSADTPQRISVTIAGDTAGGAIGQGLTTEGLRLTIPLLCGANNSKSTGSWGNGGAEAGSSTPNLLDNTANNIYIGDVMVEIGSVSTDFPHEDYGTTLAKCQRYFWKIVNSPEADNIIAQGRANTTSAAVFTLSFPQTMRASPTMADSNDADFQVNRPAASSAVLSGLAAIHIQDSFTSLQCTTATELTAGHAVELRFDGGSTRFMSFSAEL